MNRFGIPLPFAYLKRDQELNEQVQQQMMLIESMKQMNLDLHKQMEMQRQELDVQKESFMKLLNEYKTQVKELRTEVETCKKWIDEAKSNCPVCHPVELQQFTVISDYAAAFPSSYQQPWR